MPLRDSRDELLAAATLITANSGYTADCRDCERAADVYVTGSLQGLCLEHAKKRESEGWQMDLSRAPNPILRKAYLTLLEWSKEPISKT